VLLTDHLSYEKLVTNKLVKFKLFLYSLDVSIRSAELWPTDDNGIWSAQKPCPDDFASEVTLADGSG